MCDRKGIVTPIIVIVTIITRYLGVLCGECKNGMGVSALLSRCVDCSNINSLLIVTLSECMSILKLIHCVTWYLVIVDAIIVLIMLRWNHPFPTLMYPCLFYLQVLCPVIMYSLIVSHNLTDGSVHY